MNEKESIGYLYTFDDFCESLECLPDYRGALAIAVLALEKQIPKKPIIKPDKYTDLVQQYYCPNCGRYFGQAGIHNVILFSKEKYCQGEGCGQAIDWDMKPTE